MTKVAMEIPWHGFVGTALWTLVVSCCLAVSLPQISSWWSGATPCSAVPECVEKVSNAYPQSYHAFVAVGLGVVLLREGTLLLVSVADQLMMKPASKKRSLSHRLEFKDFLAQYLLCMLLSSLTAFETYLASTSVPLVHVLQDAVVPVYTVRYIEWLVDVPLLMILTCCGALGRPLSQALGPIVATNCYIIASWAALFVGDACVRNTVITAILVAYAWASERMIQWVKDFLRESQDVPCRNTRVASVILLIVVFGIYGIIYVSGVAGLISFEMEHLGYTFMGFSCKVTLSILFASIRAYQNHQVLARLVGKLRGVSVAFVSLLRGSFDHVVPCAVSPDGMCHLPERGSRDFQDLERFLGKTMEESNNFNDLLDKDDRERFTNYVKNAVRQKDQSFQQMDAGSIASQPPVAHALHISLQRDAVLVHLSLVPDGGESDRRGNRLAAFLALQITSQESEWPMDHGQMRDVEDKVTDVPYSSGTPSTDDVSTEGHEGQRISLSGTRDTEDELSATISLGEAAKRSNVGKNISNNKRRKRDAKLLVKILQRRLRRKSKKDSEGCETPVADLPGCPGRVPRDRQSDCMSRMSDKTNIQKVSFTCGGSDVLSQSSKMSAANSVMMACRQLLGPLHDALPPSGYMSRRVEDHLQCSAEMVQLKASCEISRHSQKQKMDEWKRRHDAHQLSVMLEKSGAPGCGLPEQLWRSEVLENLNESHPGPRPKNVHIPTEEELWHKAWMRTYAESESGSSGEGEDP